MIKETDVVKVIPDPNVKLVQPENLEDSTTLIMKSYPKTENVLKIAELHSLPTKKLDLVKNVTIFVELVPDQPVMNVLLV